MNQTLQRIIFIVLSFFPYYAMSSEQELLAASCVECHSRMTGGDGSVLYKREDSIITSKSSLADRVTHCANGADAGWNQEQIEMVTDYLNTTYYHY